MTDGRPDQAQVAVGHAVDRRGDLGRHQRARAGRRTSATGCSGRRRGRRHPRRRGQGPGRRQRGLAEYLETVVRERAGWRTSTAPAARSAGDRCGRRTVPPRWRTAPTSSASATTGRARPARVRRRARPDRARRGADRGPAGGGRTGPLRRRRRHGAAGRAARLRRDRRRPARASGRSRCSPPSGRRCGGRWTTVRSLASSTCRREPCSRTGRPAHRSSARRARRGRRGDRAGRPVRPDRPAGRGRRLRRPRALVGRRHRVPFGRCRRFEAITEAMAALREAGSPAYASRRGRRGPARGATCARPARGAQGRRSSASPSSAAPGTRRRSPARCRRPRPTPRCSRGCRRPRSAMTWVPWTHSRLASASGYGAGIDVARLVPPPVHRARPTVVPRWLTKVAGLLRAEDLPVSSAHVIEAVRLAEALARCGAGRWPGSPRSPTRPGRCSVTATTAARAGDPRRLVVGERLGAVPDDDADRAAGARTCARQQRRLRLTLDAAGQAARARPAQAERPRLAAGCCTGSRCSGRLGHAGAERSGTGHVPGDVVAGLGARAVGRSRWPALGHDRRWPRRRRRVVGPRHADGTARWRAHRAGRGAACWPSSPGAARGAARARRPGRARCRRGPPHGGAAGAGARVRYGDVRGTDTAALGEVADGAAGADLRRRCRRA